MPADPAGSLGAPAQTRNPDRGPDRDVVAAELRRWSARSLSIADTREASGAGRVLPDESFDRYARIVKKTLNVPIALVTIVESDRQIFPGAAGLPPEVEAERQTPLSSSFCKHVVYESAPLVVEDTRVDPRVSDNLAIEQFGVLGYAGFPLRDSTGVVIGSLCALSLEPRQWTEADLSSLADLAEACTTEIVIRELRKQAIDAARDAWDVSYRARVLLALSERLAGTLSLSDVAGALLRVAIEELDCNHAGIWVIDPDDETSMRYVHDPHLAWPQAEHYAHVPLSVDNPFGASVLNGEPLFFATRASQNSGFPALGDPDLPNDGHARTFLPLTVAGQPVGCLVLLWIDQREFSDDDHLTIGALTASAANAVQRASLLDNRASAAAKLQQALLTTLPRPSGLQLAARYRAAKLHDEVGGDWYDALVLPDGATAVIIGDVVGHDADAIAAMGSLRTMLRTFAWDHHDAPSAIVSRLDHAVGNLHPGMLCTVLMARVDEQPDGRQQVSWTNAGHHAPLLIRPDGRCETLDGAGVDRLVGVAADFERRDNVVQAEPGATLLLFTNGLIESRGEDVDAGRARLIETLRATANAPVEQLLDTVVETMVGDATFDDVAVLAVRFA